MSQVHVPLALKVLVKIALMLAIIFRNRICISAKCSVEYSVLIFEFVNLFVTFYLFFFCSCENL